ncbi:MAG: LamG domain-containing protein [Deltaproteobacteria bacterium]|nr:LamG domain-containing protein [Deltaproteobacteria bacterium]
MVSFTTKIRTHYSDIDGLVLDCRPSSLADDGSLWINRAPPARSVDRGTHDGADGSASLLDSTKAWRDGQLVGKIAYNLTDGSAGLVTGNTEHEVIATLVGGLDNDWGSGDDYVISTPRFGNPYQDVETNRPIVTTVGGVKQAAFTRINSHYLEIPLERGFLAEDWTVAFDYRQGADTANLQTILGFDNLEIFRRDAAGDYGFRYGTTPQAGSGDLTDGTWTLAQLTSSSATMYQDGSPSFTGTASATAIDDGTPAGFIGSAYGASQFCDMTLRSLQIWNRQVAPLEVDFAYQSLNAENDYSVQPRATLERRVWSDDTSTVPRINPHRMAGHRFVVAEFSGHERVQIAALVDGRVRPDSDLDGKLFQLTPVEVPGVPPAVYQDAGWSSVFDVVIDTAGHHTFCLSREDGGAAVLHLDASETA